MKDNFVSVNVVLDRSGSMGPLTNDTIGGFNTFLAEQKEQPGDAVLTLCTFNTDYKLVYDFEPLAKVKKLTKSSYRPLGGTALLDALGTTINSVGAKLSAMNEADRPSKVIVLVITDGEENASKEFTKEQVKEMVKHQQDVYSWQFLYIGANVDSISEATTLGFSQAASLSYNATSEGTEVLYKSLSRGMSTYRSTGPACAAAACFDNPIDVVDTSDKK